MDYDQFDNLTRSLATGVSRRQVLKALLAIFLGRSTGLFFSSTDLTLTSTYSVCTKEAVKECISLRQDIFDKCNSDCALEEPKERKICRSTCKRNYERGISICRQQGCPAGKICCGGNCINPCCSAGLICKDCINNASCSLCSACDDEMGGCKSECGPCQECRRILRFITLCKNSCGKCQTCEDGKCQSCPENSCCDGVCKDLTNDPNNCGSCGQKCGEGGVCCNGVCCSAEVGCCGTGCGKPGYTCCADRFFCSSDQICCNGTCVASNCRCIKTPDGKGELCGCNYGPDCWCTDSNGNLRHTCCTKVETDHGWICNEKCGQGGSNCRPPG